MKTFWCAPGGWSDRQLADGTVIVTSPTGRTYTTHPGCRIFFPTAHHHRRPAPTGRRGAFRRPRTDDAAAQTTRAADYARRIKRERALNDAYIAERNKPPPFQAGFA